MRGTFQKPIRLPQPLTWLADSYPLSLAIFFRRDRSPRHHRYMHPLTLGAAQCRQQHRRQHRNNGQNRKHGNERTDFKPLSQNNSFGAWARRLEMGEQFCRRSSEIFSGTFFCRGLRRFDDLAHEADGGCSRSCSFCSSASCAMVQRNSSASAAGSSPSSSAVMRASISSRMVGQGSWRDSRFRQFGGDGFQRVMQNETDVAGGQPGPRGDVLVGKFVVEFQPTSSRLRSSSAARLNRTRPMPSSRMICSSGNGADRRYRRRRNFPPRNIDRAKPFCPPRVAG